MRCRKLVDATIDRTESHSELIIFLVLACERRISHAQQLVLDIHAHDLPNSELLSAPKHERQPKFADAGAAERFLDAKQRSPEIPRTLSVEKDKNCA